MDNLNAEDRAAATDRKGWKSRLLESEELFRLVWESSLDAMRLTDVEGTVLAVNPAYEKMAGVPKEELVGRPFWIIYDPALAEKMMVGYRRRISNLDLGERKNSVPRLRDGRLLHLDVLLSVVSGTPEPVYLTVMRDVTKQKLQSEQRARLERKMLEAQRLESLGVLAGGIAHDFNNLLTAILGNASLSLMQLGEESPVRPALEGIQKASLRAADLCKQMLAYSGQGPLQFKKLSINSLLEQMDHLLQVSINKQIVLKFKPAPGLPPVMAEPSELQQVVVNLVVNASEAIGDRSGVISLSTGLDRLAKSDLREMYLAPDLPEGDYVTMEIADTGCGMERPTMERMFDPFFSTKFTGRGLGLAAVLGILNRHKAAFKVYSELGRGTTFKILFPCVVSGEEEGEPAPLPGHWRARGTVLVIDDEQTVRAVAGRLLESFGLSILLARDGEEGVALYQRYHDEVDLVMLDMTMPVMSGAEAFREIRHIRPDALVLLISGYSEGEANERFAGKGLSGFLQKPFNREQLEEKLRQLLPPPDVSI